MIVVCSIRLNVFTYHQDCGSLLAVAVNTCCLALLDAACPLRWPFAAVTCIQTDQGELMMNAPKQHEESALSVLTVVVAKYQGTDNVIALHSDGLITQELQQKMVAMCKSNVQSVFDFYEESLRNKICSI